jgi:hypothetical protein
MRALVGMVLLVACSGERAQNVDAISDQFGLDAVRIACDPAAQTGCDPGEKCQWIRDVASAARMRGQLGCVALGPRLLGEACEYGASGPTTGYDDWARGLICDAPADTDEARGTCAAICDTSAASACASMHACELRAGYFANASDLETTTTGMCE